MKIRIYILKIALITSAIFLLNQQGNAQGNILELLPGVDKFEYNEETGIHRLFGSGGVNFIYQGNTMYCDSAHYWSKTEEVRAYGSVHIVKEDLNLYCDSLYYNGNTRKAKLWSNVRVRDQEYKIITDTLEYDTKKSVGIYRYGGKVESILKNEVLTSRVGYMYSETKNMFFSGKVNYKTPELNIKTDTLRYNYSKKTTYFFGPTTIVNTAKDSKEVTHIYCENGWYNTENEEANLKKKASIVKGNTIMKGDDLYSYSKKGVVIGKGNVFYKDTTQNIEFNADYAYSSDQKRESFLTGHAIISKIDKKDTLFIHADTLFSYKDSLGNMSRMKGYYNVKVFRKDLQAKCDSIIYDKIKDKMELYKAPILWVKDKTELKGDFMEVLFTSDSIIDKVNVKGNSTVLLEIDSGKYYNQIGGKDIIAHFVNNDIYRTDVKGNARTIFFPEDNENTDTTVVIKRLGMNRIYASDLRLDIDSNEVQGVSYIDKPDGVFYPMDQIKVDEQFIQGFKWLISQRPKTWKEILE